MFQRKPSGFTLIEAVVAVAVVSIASLFILRAFSLAIGGMRLSQDMTSACFAAESKVWDLRRQSLSGIKIVPGEEKIPVRSGELACSWTVEPVVGSKLVRAVIKVRWTDRPGGPERSVSLSTAISQGV